MLVSPKFIAEQIISTTEVVKSVELPVNIPNIHKRSFEKLIEDVIKEKENSTKLPKQELTVHELPKDENLVLLGKVYVQAANIKPQVFISLTCDYLFYQNEMCRVLVGRARSLKVNYLKWSKDQNQNPPASESSPPFLVYLGASRKLMSNYCYCRKDQCSGDCETLKIIFTITETESAAKINEVLVATYGTADILLIEAIREDTRKKKAAEREIEYL